MTGITPLPANVTNTTGTYNFAPSMGESVLYAYGLCGIRPTQLTQQHFFDARMATNLLMGRWSADGVNLWQVDLQTIPLQQGCSTYAVPANTIVILDAYYTLNPTITPTDRILMPVSRTEYASYPNKSQQGAPTVFWFDRLLEPTITLWPVPNGQQASLSYYRLRQTQDSEMTSAQNVEVPYYFLEAYAFGLAFRLALSWAPEKVPVLKGLADEAWALASKQNVETSNFYISPVVSQYWR